MYGGFPVARCVSDLPLRRHDMEGGFEETTLFLVGDRETLRAVSLAHASILTLRWVACLSKVR